MNKDEIKEYYSDMDIAEVKEYYVEIWKLKLKELIEYSKFIQSLN